MRCYTSRRDAGNGKPKAHAPGNRCIEKANEQGKFIAATCAAPMILGELGMLEGKNATSFPDYQKYLTGANVCDKPVVVDKNIITAKGAGAASMFGFTLGGLLFGNAAAENLKGKMQYDG